MEAIPRFEIFERSFQADAEVENPFVDVELSVCFTDGDREMWVDGFYDGDQTYRVRFAPPETGLWKYRTRSNLAALHHICGEFTCTEAVSRGGLTMIRAIRIGSRVNGAALNGS